MLCKILLAIPKELGLVFFLRCDEKKDLIGEMQGILA